MGVTSNRATDDLPEIEFTFHGSLDFIRDEVLGIVAKLCESNPEQIYQTAHKDTILETAAIQGIPPENAEMALKFHVRDGTLAQPRPDEYRLT